MQALAREVTKKAEYGDSSSVKTLGDYGNDLAETSVYTSLEEGIKHLIEKMKVSVPDVANYWSVGISGNSYYKNMNFAFYAQQFAKDSTTNALKGLFKNITVSEVGIPIPGTNVSMGISGISSVFMGLDFVKNLQEENAGRAFTHTVATTAIATLAVDAAATTLAAAYYATGSEAILSVAAYAATGPIGWAIGAGIAAATLATLAYNYNFLGIKDIANEMGDNLNKSISDVGKAFDFGIKSIQKVFGW